MIEARFAPDTNICIRHKRPEEVLRRFRTLDPGEAGISVIARGELRYGAAKSALRTATPERLRESVHFLPTTLRPETAA